MKLREITRTEAFFTSVLYSTSEIESANIQEFLKAKIAKIDPKAELVDSGCEVCFFRDFALAYDLPRENNSFEKQTFDNVYIFSDTSIVLIEAKANQAFDTEQIQKMVSAKQKIIRGDFPFENVFLVGLCSSRYKPKETTIEEFDAVINWNEISDCFENNKDIFDRADLIYNDR